MVSEPVVVTHYLCFGHSPPFLLLYGGCVILDRVSVYGRCAHTYTSPRTYPTLSLAAIWWCVPCVTILKSPESMHHCVAFYALQYMCLQVYTCCAHMRVSVITVFIYFLFFYCWLEAVVCVLLRYSSTGTTVVQYILAIGQRIISSGA